jgi:hypothetical protein
VLSKWGERGLKGNAPLWYYVLREGEHYGVTHDLNELDSLLAYALS